jgi:hypothetical protein
MWSFEPFLRLKNPMIHRVLTTSRTISEGRYNLETTEPHLFKLAEYLDTNIASLFTEFLNSPIITYTCPPDEMLMPPFMASKNLIGTNYNGEDDDRTVRTAYTGGTSFYSRCTNDRSESSDDDSDNSIAQRTEQPGPLKYPPPPSRQRAPQIPTQQPVETQFSNINHQPSAFGTYSAVPRSSHTGISPAGRPSAWNSESPHIKIPPATALNPSPPPTTIEAQLIHEIRELKEGMAKLMQENRTLLQERHPHHIRASHSVQEPSPPVIPTEIFTVPLPPLPPPLVSQSPAVSSVTGMMEFDGKLQAVLQESRQAAQEAKRQQKEDQAAMRQEWEATTQRQEKAMAELRHLLEGALEHRAAPPENPATNPRPLPRAIAFDSETEHPSKRPDLKQSPAKGAGHRPLAARRNRMTDGEGDPPNPNNDTSSPG